MAFSENENRYLTSENMEHEDKVNIEETSVNFGYVKKELDEEELEFEEKQYKIALNLENIFGKSSIEQRNNRDGLIGFLNGDVVMKIETETVKLKDVKEENTDLLQETIEESHCNKCGGNYQGYCLNCSSLSHILNNLTPNLNPEPILNTIPINVLEIREVSTRQSVFALKTLPKGIIIGPFQGIAPIESTTGLQWKIKNKKFVNDQNGNWMKYIDSVANHASKNLDVFQFDGILYFETSREIQEGEELLVCYGVEEEVLKSNKDEEFYIVPVKKEEYPKVFACTLCCLGFRLERCLVDHKSKCPRGNSGGSIQDFEIIQCPCCKVWLEKQEHLENHMMHCFENYNGLCRNISHYQRKPTDEIDEALGNGELSTFDVNKSHLTQTEVIYSKYSGEIGKTYKIEYFSEKKYHCFECSYQTNLKGNLKLHLNTHKDIKPFECDICKKNFTQKSNLKLHIKIIHSNTSEKQYKCFECSYQTNRKDSLRGHLNTHNDIKPFECDICKMRFKFRKSVTQHMRNQHSNTSEKEYKCSECSYETNYKSYLNKHLYTHSGVKPFECDICKKKFKQKISLKKHMKNKHLSTSKKKHKCSECSYQTNCKSSLKQHLNTHIKRFECDICKKRYIKKNSLIQHIRNQHSNRSKKEYKCSKCPYQTKWKSMLQVHLNTHIDFKPFQCDICKKKFTQKSHLKVHIENVHSNTSEKEYKCSECPYQTNFKSTLQVHIKNQHSNTSEKEYKCSECSYQTNYKDVLKNHLNTHTDIKPFECDICKQKFNRKTKLKLHIRNQHSNVSDKEYKCSQCSYQTNRNDHLKSHLYTHMDIKRFECYICKKRFTQTSSLNYHVKNQHSESEKEYKCSECSYQTNRNDHLKSHLNTHMGIKPFEYDICKKSFTQKQNLNKHIENIHSNTIEKK